MCESSGPFTHMHKHTTSNTQSESVFDSVNTQAFCLTDCPCEEKKHCSSLRLILYIFTFTGCQWGLFWMLLFTKPKTRMRNDFIKLEKSSLKLCLPFYKTCSRMLMYAYHVTLWNNLNEVQSFAHSICCHFAQTVRMICFSVKHLLVLSLIYLFTLSSPPVNSLYPLVHGDVAVNHHSSFPYI